MRETSTDTGFMMNARRMPVLPAGLLLAVVGAGLAVVGSYGPWATVMTEAYRSRDSQVIVVKGTDVDGWLTFGFCVVAAGLILWRLLRSRPNALLLTGAAVLLLATGVIGTLNWLDAVYRSGSFSWFNLPAAPQGFNRTGAEVSWGVILMTVAAWAGMASAAYQLWKDESG